MKLARICVDCGARSLSLRTLRRGRAVLVTGPGDVGDKLDGASHVALVKLLDEVTPEMQGMPRLRKKPPRLPFFVASDHDETSAGELAGRLGEVGFEARVERRVSLRPREVRRKVMKMAGRYFFPMLGLGFAFATQVTARLPEAALSLGLFGIFLAPPVLAAGSALLVPMLQFRRPLVALGVDPSNAEGVARLGQWLGRIKRREDRRLLARVVDRLQLAASLGTREPVELLTGRAELACRGLAALDDGVRHLDEADLRRAVAGGHAGDEVTAALDALREAERRRAVLIADLLRTFSRAEQICVSRARAESLAAGEQAALSAREVEELKAELEAEEDIAGLLS